MTGLRRVNSPLDPPTIIDRQTCEHCGRTFAQSGDLYNHLKASHPKRKRAHLRPARQQSLGDELAEAILNAKADIAPSEHLAVMFPEAFEEE